MRTLSNWKITTLAAVAMLVACASPGMVQISPDTYLITRADYSVGGTGRGMKIDVIREANAFAESQGKVVIPIHVVEVPVASWRYATIEYQFRLVDKDDPEAKSTPLDPRPDFVLKTDENVKVDVTKEDISEKPTDIYAELIKLDDLRQRGILTDEAYEQGYWDALACVKRKGGSASAAAYDCEDE